MTTPIPFEVFSSEVLPGEKIEWTGRPNPAVIFHQEDWLVIPFSLMWGGFAIFWLLSASGISDIWTHRPKGVDKRVRPDGIGSISFGGPVKGETQWGRGNPPRPPTFDDVNNVDSVYQVAVRLHDRARKSATGTSFRSLA